MMNAFTTADKARDNFWHITGRRLNIPESEVGTATSGSGYYVGRSAGVM
jgi:hypothetical protein